MALWLHLAGLFKFFKVFIAAILPFFCLVFFTRKDCYVQGPVICCGWREIHIRQKIHIARVFEMKDVAGMLAENMVQQLMRLWRPVL